MTHDSIGHKLVLAAMQDGGHERPYQLGVLLRGGKEMSGPAFMADGLLVLQSEGEGGTTVATFIDPSEVVAVSVFPEAA